MVLKVFKAWIQFIENGGMLRFKLRTNIFWNIYEKMKNKLKNENILIWKSIERYLKKNDVQTSSLRSFEKTVSRKY